MRSLNHVSITSAMAVTGLNASGIASALDVSRASVSKWLNGTAFPRPNMLLKLALLLNLPLANLVIKEDVANDPVIAFRKRAASKTTGAHIARAKEMGKMLRPLVPYLPFDQLEKPPALKQPSTDYDYLQKLSTKLREKSGVSNTDPIDFQHIVNLFESKQTVLIPVLWGKKEQHENALHIYLPDSMTTWIYFNLDVEIHDFKFWMTHELGHVLAPNLQGNTGEDFADAVAGTMLFPECLASKAYADIVRARNVGTKINKIKSAAEKHLISPVTVYVEINRYAEHKGSPKLTLNTIFAAAKNLSKKYYSVSELLLEKKHPKVEDFISVASGALRSPFFDVLKAYLAAENKNANYIQSILNIPFLDAKEIYLSLK